MPGVFIDIQVNAASSNLRAPLFHQPADSIYEKLPNGGHCLVSSGDAMKLPRTLPTIRGSSLGWKTGRNRPCLQAWLEHFDRLPGISCAKSLLCHLGTQMNQLNGCRGACASTLCLHSSRERQVLRRCRDTSGVSAT